MRIRIIVLFLFIVISDLIAQDMEIVIYNRKGQKEVFDLYFVAQDSLLLLPQKGKNTFSISKIKNKEARIVAVLQDKFIILPVLGGYIFSNKNSIISYESKKNQYLFLNLNRNSQTLSNITNAFKFKKRDKRMKENYELRIGDKFDSFSYQTLHSFLYEDFINVYYKDQILNELIRVSGL